MKNLLLLTALALAQSGYAQFDETKIQAPIRDSNEQNLNPTICKGRENMPWDICSILFDDKTEMERSFTFSNYGGNKTVPQSGWGISRSFEFLFEDFARSDMSLLLWDMPDQTESHGHLKMMMFFPRVNLPAIRYENTFQKNTIIVTLPNQEEVFFNAETKEVIGGVLSEKPIAQDNEGNALNPAISYTGKGVVVEADRLNDYPVGLGAEAKNNLATITKKGHKVCKIPVKDLWYTDDAKNGNVFFNKNYITDIAFDKFLKSKCKFSMF